MALLIVPVLLNLPGLYIWARPEVVAGDELLKHKAPFLNGPFFISRTAFYFAAWMGLSWLLDKLSRAQETDTTGEVKGKLQGASGLGILLYGFTATFAAVDWVMTLDPHWFSTIYGVMFMVGGALAMLSFLAVVMPWLAKVEPMAGLLRPSHFQDLGNLMFAFTMLWAYVSFSQFLIIWSGNLPEETPWYLHRFHGSWGALALMLVGFHFAVPFLLLLQRALKTRPQALALIAGGMLFMRLADLIWVTVPGFHGGHARLSWMDAAAPVGIGGLWVAYFLTELGKRPLMPVEAHLLGGQGGHS
jgi:hypothetical protein